jgi:hypothetical protein
MLTMRSIIAVATLIWSFTCAGYGGSAEDQATVSLWSPRIDLTVGSVPLTNPFEGYVIECVRNQQRPDVFPFEPLTLRPRSRSSDSTAPSLSLQLPNI